MQADARHLDRYLCLDDFEKAATRRLPRRLFVYGSDASETGASLRHNREDFANYAFRPRVLRDVSQRKSLA
jgi:L-lactate dehydrogenase (cytochrome)